MTEEPVKYVVDEKELGTDEYGIDLDFDLLCSLYAIGVDTPELLLYSLICKRRFENPVSSPIEKEIDLAKLQELTECAFDRKKTIKVFKRLQKFNLVQVKESANWKHHRVVVNPINYAVKELEEKLAKRKTKNG